MIETYAQILLPLPLGALFTYHVPQNLTLRAKVGHRAIVPFGRKRFYTGIICALTPVKPDGIEVRDIALIPDDYPIVRHPQLKLWEWLADYYLCAPGDVYKAALPSGLKIESETFIENNPDYEFSDADPLTEREAIIYQTLDHEGHLTIDAIQAKTGLKSLPATIDAMINRGVVIISEKLVERYRPKREKFVRPLFDREHVAEAFEQVNQARKQETLLLALIELSKLQLPGRQQPDEVSREVLLKRADCAPAILNALEKKQLVEVYTKEINRFAFNGAKTIQLPTLSEAQSQALAEINQSWLSHDITLLHGVTSSGKTEIYQHLIARALDNGKQVLYLVPEIALTTQLTQRLQAVFGKRVIIYHSKFSDNERVDIWKQMLSDSSPKVIIGARSSLFLPFAKLGIVIVDEEHEQSYKQFDPAPRYNARDAAIVLASMHGAKTVLGSATPSIETYYKAQIGKFGLVTLSKRWSDAPLPTIQLVDTLRQRKAGNMKGTFAFDTIKKVRSALNDGNQAIIFIPRRGYSPLARCRQCAWTPRCSRCDVPLTYHRDINLLVCHYCGTTTQLPRTCPQCHEPAIETIGYGTERVQDEINALFPNKVITRMDLDTTRNKSSYLDIITDFSQNKSDILVGTQMVTKGLDFGNVSVVTVLNTDSMINMPDFRAAERAFNTLQQVAGRAGRRSQTPGQVIIQTASPGNELFTHLINNDYTSFYKGELSQRQKYFYPPFSRIIYIYLKHRDKATINRVAQEYGHRLQAVFGHRVYGPEKPAVERINALYIRKLMLKIEPDASMKHVKTLLKQIYDQAFQDPSMKSVTIYYDVDPA